MYLILNELRMNTDILYFNHDSSGYNMFVHIRSNYVS